MLLPGVWKRFPSNEVLSAQNVSSAHTQGAGWVNLKLLEQVLERIIMIRMGNASFVCSRAETFLKLPVDPMQRFMGHAFASVMFLKGYCEVAWSELSRHAYRWQYTSIP